MIFSDIFFQNIKNMSTLFEHQKDALEKLTQWEDQPMYGVTGGLLNFTMGLGKTRTMLELIYRKNGSTLVVCSKSNIQVWVNEIEKFYKDKLTYYILHPSYNKKLEEFRNIYDYDVIITTYEVVRSQFTTSDIKCYIGREFNFLPTSQTIYKQSQLPSDYKIVTVKKCKVVDGKIPESEWSIYTPIYSTYWRRIISDESQRFAGMNTKLSKAMIALNARGYFCLSGTPIVNYNTDLYSLFRFMGMYCEPKEWNKRHYFTLKLETRILSKDYEDTNIKLPDVVMKDIVVELSPIERKMYDEFVENLKDKMSQFKVGAQTFSAPLAMITRLRQICACAYIITKEAKNDKIKNENEPFFKNEELNKYLYSRENIKYYTKIKKTRSLVKEITERNEKVIIFSSFTSVLRVLKAALAKHNPLQLDGSVSTEDRNDMIKYFNEDSKCSVLLCSYKAGGVGLNITGANNVILYEPWWNSATEEQAIARSHRIGQEKAVTVYSLIAHPSFEAYLLKKQRIKNDIAKEFIEGHKQTYEKGEKCSTIVSLMEEICNGNILY